MKKFHLLLAATLLLAQLPLSSLAAPVEAGMSLAGHEALHTVSGGACANCHSNPTPTPPPDPHPTRLGSPYWEHTRTQQISYTDPGGQLVYHELNNSNTHIARSFTYTSTNAFNWTVGGGVPGGIISASLGSSYSRTETTTGNVVIPPRSSFKYYTSNPTTRYHYTFTRWQDWSDGSRQTLNTGIIPGSRISTKSTTIFNPL